MLNNKSTLTEMVDKTFSELLKSISTSIPAYILDFDSSTQTAKVQISIEFIDKQANSFAIAPIVNVPVHFAGGGYTIEHEIKPDDEGILVVSQRCIDGWKENGGISPQTVLRKLDIQDSLFIPGFRSKPNVITGFNNDGIMLRNKSGTQSLWLKSDDTIRGDNGSGYFELKPNGDFVINGLIINTAGEIFFNGKNITTHLHLAGSPPGNTGPNV